ncbi:MAG: GAF domain-containing protein [Thermoleophilia bacterium]|nr:GAF domain-containing protein [Thermoleophilia bacterium]
MTPVTARSDAVLARIISTVASTLELDEVLRAVVRLLSDASGVHACFVYLVEDDALVLRAAGDPYEGLIGKVSLERGNGLAWWAAERNEPAFIPDNLLADPRVAYVPELDEERFQSLLSVPIAARDGTVIGVISAHTEAPHAFTQDEVDFVVTSASLVAAAIENARLYDETRARVEQLEAITELAEVIAGARTLDELLPEVVARSRGLLRSSTCHLYLLAPGSEEFELQASAPASRDSTTRTTLGLAELGPELARGGRRSRVAVPLIAGDELLGLLVAEQSTAVELARAVASQIAVGVKKIQLIESLTEKNLIKDFFEALAAGRDGGGIASRAIRLGCDLDRRHVVLAAEPADEALARTLLGLFPGSLFDRREESLHGLLRLPAGGGERATIEIVRRVHADSPGPLSIGLSSACEGLTSFAGGFEEARQALFGTTVLNRVASVVAFEELGAYKYLLRIAADGGVRDATVDAVRRIAEYDCDRGASLLPTLEEFLKRRGSISATSEALFIHANTLRQRLRRIGDLSGIDLRRDDWLMIEIAVKLVQLRSAHPAR